MIGDRIGPVNPLSPIVMLLGNVKGMFDFQIDGNR